MVCYARPAIRMAALLLVLFLAFGRPAAHYLDSAALFVAVAMAVAVAAVAAAVAFTMFLSVRRGRAAAGGCVSCQLRCQPAMTEQPRRLLLVSTVDRGATSRPAAPAAPRWPDRPAIRSGVTPRAAGRERAGSAVLPTLVLGSEAVHWSVGRVIVAHGVLRELLRTAFRAVLVGLQRLVLRGDRRDLPGQLAAVKGPRVGRDVERGDRPHPAFGHCPGHAPGVPALLAGPGQVRPLPPKPHATDPRPVATPSQRAALRLGQR